MADQNPQHGRRQHFHRGRRGQDRRGNDRRGPAPAQSPEQAAREHVDVEQIMREIRSRISQRHGIELTTQQIQELAARRLEAILDPRTVKPSLLEQIRKTASTPVDATTAPEPPYSFEDSTIYDSHRGALRFMRRLLNPLLKLFFNPNPLISALNAQARLNQAAAQREAERDRRQTEWNALHYEILQRLVLEIARTSLEAQQLSLRVEALSAKVEFAERRARSIESALHQSRPSPRHEGGGQPAAQAVQQSREPGPADGAAAPVVPEGGVSEGGRRRRRRRRGRRPPGFTPEGAPIAAVAGAAVAGSQTPESAQTPYADDGDDDEGAPDGGDEGEAAPLAVDTTPVDVAPVDVAPVDVAPADVAPVDVEAAPSPAFVSSPQESPVPLPALPPEASIDTPTEAVSTDLPDRSQPPEPVGD